MSWRIAAIVTIVLIVILGIIAALRRASRQVNTILNEELQSDERHVAEPTAGALSTSVDR